MNDQERGTTSQDEVAKAKAEVQQEVNEARAKPTAEIPGAERILAEKLLNELRAKSGEAQEVRDLNKASQGLSIEQKRKEAVSVKVTLIKVLEAVKEGVIKPPQRTQSVLTRLAERGGLTDTTASYLQPLLQKYINIDISFSKIGEELTQFEKDFRQLTKDNAYAAQLLGEILEDSRNRGQLGNITKVDMQRQLGLEIDEEGRVSVPEDEKQKSLKRASRGYPGEGEAPTLTATEEKRLDQLSNKFQRSEKVSNDDKKRVPNLLRSGQITQEVKIKLAQAEFSPEEIEEILNLVEKANRSVEETIRYENYIEEADQQKFDIDYLFNNNLVDSGGFTNIGKRELKKALLKSINKLMGKVDAHPDSDFQTNYSEFHEGYVYRYIEGLVEKLRDNPRWKIQFGGPDTQEYRNVMRFINEGLLEEIGRERELRELFHNIGIYIKTLTPEKLTEFMQRYNVSTVSSVATNDFSGKIVSLAMSEYERYLKFDIMKNHGKIRSGLFSGQTNPNLLYFENADRAILEERLRNTLIGLQRYIGYNRIKQLTPEQQKEIADKFRLIGIKAWDIDSILNFEEWELKRALKYAKGLELTQTIRGPEIIASSRPPLTYEGSADNYYDMASFINPNWKWRTGRGEAGWRETHIPETLMAETIKKRPEPSFWKRIFTKGFNPKEIHGKIKKYSEHEMAKKWEHIKDSWLYHDIDFQRLLNKFGLGGLASRAGWRLVGFKGNSFLKNISLIQEAILDSTGAASLLGKEFKFGKNGERWTETYEQLAKAAGIGTRFWFDGARATDYVKEALWKEIHIDPKKTSEDELDKLWEEYTEGEKGDKVVFTLDGEKYTTLEYLEAKTLVLRGMNFFALLKRSPMDFLNNIVNLTPQLLTERIGTTEDGREEGTKDIFFEFDKGKLEAALKNNIYNGKSLDLKNPADIDNLRRDIEEFQWKQRRIWGEKNFEHLKFIREFYHRLEEWGDKNKNIDKKNKTSAAIFEEFFKQMDLAVEKVRLRNGERMKSKNIKDDVNDIEDEVLNSLIFGGKDANGKEFEGLVTHFVKLQEDFGERQVGGKWKDEKLGQDGFFYHFARGWYNELGHALHPDTSDVDWRLVFHKLGASGGENMIKRLWSDLHQWNEVMNGLMQLDHMFIEAGHAHSLEKIKELHHKIHSLEGIAGKNAINEAEFYLAQLVGRYFQEHYAARLPFPLGSIYSLFNGKQLSLSKIYGGRGAMSLTTDGLNAYFQELMHTGMIPEEGQFGFKKLSQALGADWQKLVVTEMVPNIFMALMLFLLWKYISESLREAEGKKK